MALNRDELVEAIFNELCAMHGCTGRHIHDYAAQYKEHVKCLLEEHTEMKGAHEHSFAGREGGYRCSCGVVRPDRDDLPPNSPRR